MVKWHHAVLGTLCRSFDYCFLDHTIAEKAEYSTVKRGASDWQMA